jgi:hypothetical protein
MTGDVDPKTNFALIVIQTELERYKYLVRSYLRARIAKVSRGGKCIRIDRMQGHIASIASRPERPVEIKLLQIPSQAGVHQQETVH